MLTVLKEEPMVDWRRLGLDLNVNDDRIIASMIDRKNTEDMLASDDIGILLKADVHMRR